MCNVPVVALALADLFAEEHEAGEDGRDDTDAVPDQNPGEIQPEQRDEDMNEEAQDAADTGREERDILMQVHV